MPKKSKLLPDDKKRRRDGDYAPEPKITKNMIAGLTRIIGVDDSETVTAFHLWLEEKAEVCRSVPEVMIRVENSEEAAEGELPNLAMAAQKFADAIKTSPNISEHVRLSYAKELAEDPSWDDEVLARRRLDRDLEGAIRLFAAIEAANHRVARDQPNRPHLVGLRKAAEHLAGKFEDLSYQKFHFSVPQVNDGESVWEHPHTSLSTKFVAAALKVIFPKASDANIMWAFREMQPPDRDHIETS